jgi:hypothetical protein
MRGRAPMSAEAVAVSLGLGPAGLPAEFRAAPNELPAPSTAPQFVMATPASALAEAQELIRSLGGVILRSDPLGSLGLEMTVFDLAGGITADELRAIIGALGIDATVDPNHLFGTSQGRRVFANDLVGATPVGQCRLAQPVRIGLIDGPVDRGNPYLSDLDLTSWSAIGAGEQAGSAGHATGIASLLAASPRTDGFGGIAPGAKLYSAEAFVSYTARDAASVEGIAKSMDWLLSQRTEIINMSIAGPFNRVFQRIIGIAASDGTILVAASGNDGVERVSYPGSDPAVIAATAVDAAKRLYGSASFGAEVEFAAPGVDVLVAEGDGLAYRSGTSYAAAVLSGVIAHRLAAPGGGGSVDGMRADLRTASEDLGRVGWDPRFGWGLARLPDCAP